ncbi:MAG: hypothetical protein BroJett022_10960 [Actinomycetes bacterium]|nr:MAG: hypothetical protein BroJett022_10960 [Actinomycetes bacterium]
MLKLRRGVVVEAGEDGRLVVEVDGERRRAWADEAMVGPAAVGDDVVVNTAALDLGLGSGGFDIVHVNLTGGLDGGATPPGVHVMKLNYSPLQHPVDPVELPADAVPRPARRPPVLVLPLHGHLAPAAWAASRCGAGAIGFIQAGGGGLPGGLSTDVRELRRRGLLAGAVTASPSYGGEREAISLVGALHAAAEAEAWEAILVGPGPGILGSSTRYGHGGMAALDAAHAALALEMPTLLSPRMSSGDPRPRHLGLSHHTRSVLDLLLGAVEVPLPEGLEALWPLAAGDPDPVIAEAGDGHRLTTAAADLPGYAESGLPRRTMGRDLDRDRLFFAAPLAAGAALAAAR